MLIGRTVRSVRIHNRALRWPVPRGLEKNLSGRRFIAIGRRSKYLLLNCDGGTLIIHLGMTGHLRCVPDNESRKKHDHVELLLDDGRVLRFNDSRRFGAILWTNDDPLQHPLLAVLGPEPFDKSFTADYLAERARNRVIAVKPFLMDAKIVVGVGNIYASESLHRAGIDPRRAAGQVSRAAFGRLVRSVKEVLAEAIAAGGTTIRDFANSDGEPGYFSTNLRVYGREGEPCTTCGAPVRQARLGQRSTFFCARCQR